MRSSPQDDIWKATKRGDLDAVRRFVERDGVPDVEDDWAPDSLLSVACEAGHADVVRFLLEQGARSTRFVGRTPEAFVAMRGGHLEVVRVLCEFGLDPNSTCYSKHDLTLFQRAVEERRVEFVRLFVEQGDYWGTAWEEPMDAELTDDERESEQLPPEIELAARAGDVEFVEFMLEVGVELNGQDASYYLQKAQENAPRFEQTKREKEEVEEEQRTAREVATQGGGWCLWGCLGLILGPLALIGIFYRVAVWMGWEAVAFGCVFIGVIYVVMRVSRWGQA